LSHYRVDKAGEDREATLNIRKFESRLSFLVLIFDSEDAFISQLYGFHQLVFPLCKLEDECVMKQIAEKNRKQLEAKLANVFDDQITELSTELREILLDDMVTAFENRLNVLNSTIEKVVC
jgi:hypothetical protein